MFARASTLRGSSESIDQAVADLREKVIPWGRLQEGFAGGLALANRAAGKLIRISFWDSADAMSATEEGATRQREATAISTGAEILSVESFEVLLDERG